MCLLVMAFGLYLCFTNNRLSLAAGKIPIPQPECRCPNQHEMHDRNEAIGATKQQHEHRYLQQLHDATAHQPQMQDGGVWLEQ